MSDAHSVLASVMKLKVSDDVFPREMVEAALHLLILAVGKPCTAEDSVNVVVELRLLVGPAVDLLANAIELLDMLADRPP